MNDQNAMEGAYKLKRILDQIEFRGIAKLANARLDYVIERDALIGAQIRLRLLMDVPSVHTGEITTLTQTHTFSGYELAMSQMPTKELLHSVLDRFFRHEFEESVWCNGEHLGGDPHEKKQRVFDPGYFR